MSLLPFRKLFAVVFVVAHPDVSAVRRAAAERLYLRGVADPLGQFLPEQLARHRVGADRLRGVHFLHFPKPSNLIAIAELDHQTLLAAQGA
ncbi:hypothetical protein Y032_0084g1726 [Ancylostoma ceylanicum]|uniref:Uncharacterized protein n=1 Tax=Ancylostoma ceylanicum TaxID=53326 RepID=A0A016TQI8_9BILA|nr:hypothetical protein Y032_0084g1726 [Ancylostoma ceylanicum]